MTAETKGDNEHQGYSKVKLEGGFFDASSGVNNFDDAFLGI
jgi:hypothetical protein